MKYIDGGIQINGVEDIGNGTSAALGISGSFIGEWYDATAFPSIVVSAATDQDGSYSVQFSPDGVNIDSTLTRYYRTGQINPPHRFAITRKYVRVVYTNGATAQTYLRLQTHFGDYADLNSPTDGVLARDFDSIVVRPTDAHDEITLGLRQGKTTWHKWGYNENIDTGASEMVWAVGGNMTFLTTASLLNIVSSSADDTSGGSGAHGVVIYGVNENRESSIEVVFLNGTTQVQTVGAFLGVNRVAIYLSGSGQENAGTITVTANTGGSTQAVVPVGQGTTQQAIFFTQAGNKSLIDQLSINTIKQTGGSSPKVTIKAFALSFVSNSKYEIFRYSMDTSVENSFNLTLKLPLLVGEKSVIFFTAETDTNNTSAAIRFSLIEYKDANA